MRSRVTLAVIGIVLLGGAGGVAGVRSAPHAPASLASVQGTQPTATSSDSSSRVPATATTRATPGGCSSGQPGQSATLIGSIAGSNAPAQTFVVRRTASGTCTIRVTMVTTYSGGRASFAVLQPGDSATVQGTWQADGSVLATEVNAQPDNN